MSWRRPPRDPRRVLQDGIESGRLGSPLHVINTMPVPGYLDAISDAQASEGNISSVAFWNDDIYTLGSDGAQDLTLTYLPLDGSLHVELRGVKAKKGVDWSLTDKTLSLLTPLDPRTDDDVTTEYAYLLGSPDVLAPEDFFTLTVPYGSEGWKYLNVDDGGIPSGWETTGFDDSTWAVGQGGLAHTSAPAGLMTTPYTDGSTGAPGSEAGVNTDVGARIGTTPPPLGHDGNILVRRYMPPGTGITVTYDAYGGYPTVYVNGTVASAHSTGTHIADSFAVADQATPWELAVRVLVGNGNTYGAIDLAVTGAE